MKSLALIMAVLVASLMAASVFATENPMVGGAAKVTIGDVMQSNGVIHVVDTVLMP